MDEGSEMTPSVTFGDSSLGEGAIERKYYGI
jgi:hypothetical protein